MNLNQTYTWRVSVGPIHHRKGCHGGFRFQFATVPEGAINFWDWVRGRPTYATGGRCWPRVFAVKHCPRCGNGKAELAQS